MKHCGKRAWKSSCRRLVPELRSKVKAWRDGGYDGATETSKSLLNWWFNTEHLLPQADGTLMAEFQYFFAQREAWRRSSICTTW